MNARLGPSWSKIMFRGFSCLFVGCLFLPFGHYVVGAYEIFIDQKTSSFCSVAKVSAFVDSHFLGRKVVLTAHQLVNSYLFGEHIHGNVHIGRDGWLFYGARNGTDPLSSVICQKPLTTKELDEKLDAYNSRVYYAKGYGPYVAIMPPNKSTIYPEHLRFDGTGGNCPATQIEEMLSSKGRHFVPIKEVLLAEKSKQQIYSKSDSHWNYEAGWIAYREIMQELISQDPTLKAYKKSDFNFEPRSREKGGDLAGMLRIDSTFGVGDIDPAVTPVVPHPVKEVRYPAESPIAHQLPSLLRDPIKDLPPDREIWVYESDQPLNDRRILILNDSFVVAMMPFLTRTFRQVLLIPEYYGLNWTTTHLGSQIIIEQRVERNYFRW